MNDDGYTLAEAMTALAVLGLAIGGLSVVSSLIARQQFASLRLHARLVEGRAADQALNGLLAGADAISGDARSFSFPCGDGAACGATLRSASGRWVLAVQGPGGSARDLRLGDADARFSYIGAEGVEERWPAASAEPGAEEGEAPRAIILRDAASAAPLAVARLLPRGPHDCRFDDISRVCMAEGG